MANKSKYLPTEIISGELNDFRKQIYAIREKAYTSYGIDILDTDALSAISIFMIVSQYDSNYNINFSRNGEDAKSEGILIEQKACRVNESVTKKGKPRKNGERDACFIFHAMGDLKHTRYIFVARRKQDLSIVRVYDIKSEENTAKVYSELLKQREEWLAQGKLDASKMKRDAIQLTEAFILDNLKLESSVVDGCKVFKDWNPVTEPKNEEPIVQ